MDDATPTFGGVLPRGHDLVPQLQRLRLVALGGQRPLQPVRRHRPHTAGEGAEPHSARPGKTRDDARA